MAPRLAGVQVRNVRRLRADGHTHAYIAASVGCSLSTVQRIVGPGRPGKVPVAPLREAFLASGKGAVDVARAAGWRRTDERDRS